jgi:hypothetical protein
VTCTDEIFDWDRGRRRQWLWWQQRDLCLISECLQPGQKVTGREVIGIVVPRQVRQAAQPALEPPQRVRFGPARFTTRQMGERPFPFIMAEFAVNESDESLIYDGRLIVDVYRLASIGTPKKGPPRLRHRREYIHHKPSAGSLPFLRGRLREEAPVFSEPDLAFPARKAAACDPHSNREAFEILGAHKAPPNSRRRPYFALPLTSALDAADAPELVSR